MKKFFNVFTFMVLFIFLSSCTINNSHVHSYIDGMCDCGEYDLQWLNENFDLSEEKILFKGSVDDDFNCNIILLTLKHTTFLFQLDEEHKLRLDQVSYTSNRLMIHKQAPSNPHLEFLKMV